MHEREALQKIAGGHIQGLSDLALNGAWQAFATKLQEVAREALAVPIMSEETGCICYDCRKVYRSDLLVDHDVWAKISPMPVDGPWTGGLLCPTCIMDRICDAGISSVGFLKSEPKPCEECKIWPGDTCDICGAEAKEPKDAK